MPTATSILMAVGPADIAQLRALASPLYQEVVRVYWGSTVKNYANTSINELTSFPGSTAVFGFIYPRIREDRFLPFKMSTLLSDDTITLELDDHDETIKALARASGEGQRVEVYGYYPEVTASNADGLAVLRWWGLMRRPSDSDRWTFKATVNAGFRSPDLVIPKRPQHPSCSAPWAGMKIPGTASYVFDTQPKIDRNPCPYNRHIGGAVGNLDGGVPFETCPRDGLAACEARLGSDFYRWYLGFPAIGAYAQIRGKSFAFLARTEQNLTLVRKRLPIVIGTARLRGIEPLTTQSQISPIPQFEERGFLNTLYNICEGPTNPSLVPDPYGYQAGMYHLKVNNKPVPGQHDIKFQGVRGETATDGTRHIAYQLTAQIIANLNYGEFGARYPSEAKADVTVDGLSNIRVYTTTSAFTEIATQKRGWGVLEVLANKRFGLGYDYALFNIQDWLNVATWDAHSIPMLQEDGSTSSQVRSTLNVAIEERPAAQVINDLCASGRLSLPFFFQGRIRIMPLGLEDTTSLLTFSDETTHGFNPNIREDSLRFWETDESEIKNEVTATYDEWLVNPGELHPFDVYERSIILEDQQAKQAAGVILGDETVQDLKDEFQAFGVNNFAEAGRLATLRLNLGEHEAGGLQNKLNCSFQTSHEHADAFQLHPYRLIKILNVGLNAYEESDGTNYDIFRVRDIERGEDGWLTVKCIGYPKSYYAKTENGQYVQPLAWISTEANYGRRRDREPRISSWDRSLDGRKIKQPGVAATGRTIDAGRGIIVPSTGVQQVETATVVGAVAQSGTATVIVTAAGMTGSPKTLSPYVEGGITQREAGQVVGSIDTSGNAGVRITAAGMTGSPILFTVPVLAGDQPYDTALKAIIIIAANANVTALFDVRRSFDRIMLTRLVPATNDATLNIEIGNGSVFGIGSSCAGLTTESTSENTRAGVATGDTATIVATKLAAAMNADADVFEWFGVVSSGADIILTRKKAAANDATLNVSTANGTCTGLTSAPTSANTRAGVAP